MTAIVVMAKEPRAGRVKTRLCPPCTPEEAAVLADASLRDTLDAVTATRGTRGVLALDGDGGRWRRRGLPVFAQRGCGLAERLANAAADAGGPVLLIGGDTPQVTPALLADAVRSLRSADAVFGPAADGGYWAIGLTQPDARVFAGIPMSTDHTGRSQWARLQELRYRAQLLPTLRDVDDVDDALAVARAAPTTRFAAAVSALRLPALEPGAALLGER